MSEPMFAQDAVAFYLLSEQVSKTVKVVQSGQGADEVFGGYFWYPRMAAETSGSALERFRKHYFDRDHDEFLEMAMPAYHGPDYTSETIAAHLAAPFADDFIDQVLRMDTTMLITDDPVKRVDNMTMAWGLEARVPFLDHQLVELAASMPPELKLASDGKHVLKQIARGLVPDAVIDRKKGYFPMPALKFVRGEFSSSCATFSIHRRAANVASISAPTSTNCWMHPNSITRAFRAASYGIWRYWNTGYKKMRKLFFLLTLWVVAPAYSQSDFSSWLAAFRQDAANRAFPPTPSNAALTGLTRSARNRTRWPPARISEHLCRVSGQTRHREPGGARPGEAGRTRSPAGCG